MPTPWGGGVKRGPYGFFRRLRMRGGGRATPPTDTTSVPQPQSWPNIKTTYDTSIGAKITKARGDKLSKATILKGIDYWIARLNEDRGRVAQDPSLPP